jgi:hypothetical protein
MYYTQGGNPASGTTQRLPRQSASSDGPVLRRVSARNHPPLPETAIKAELWTSASPTGFGREPRVCRREDSATLFRGVLLSPAKNLFARAVLS